MKDILCPKFQLEIRYTHILNFSSISREIVAPFIKLCSNFNVINEGTLEESLRLEFLEDAFWIEFRWDRAILLTEGDLSRFDDENSSIKTFFDILKIFRQQNSFGVIKNYLQLVFLVKTSKESAQEVLSKFKDDYLNDKIYKFVKNPSDLSVVIEKSTEGMFESVTLGPYLYKDIAMRGLLPFKSSGLESLNHPDAHGRMVLQQIVENTTEYSFKTFRDKVRNIEKFPSYFQ